MFIFMFLIFFVTMLTESFSTDALKLRKYLFTKLLYCWILCLYFFIVMPAKRQIHPELLRLIQN